MSDQAKSAGSTAARVVCSITARSKLIFGAVAKTLPSRSIPRSALASSSAIRTASSASGARAPISRRPGVGAEAEHAGVPEAPLGDQLGRQPGVGLLHEARHRVAAGRQRLARRDVAVGVEGAVGVIPSVTIRPSSASRAAAAAARAKAAASGMRWSDGMIITMAEGSRRAARHAASVTAASVSRPSGSSAISISTPPPSPAPPPGSARAPR